MAPTFRKSGYQQTRNLRTSSINRRQIRRGQVQAFAPERRALVGEPKFRRGLHTALRRTADSQRKSHLEIAKRSDAHLFVVLPKRWIVERTFAWISRNRRLARDFERYARTVATFFRLATIRIMLRHLTRTNHSA